MTREQVKAGLRAYPHIDDMIAFKRLCAGEAADTETAERYLQEAEELRVVRQQLIEALNRLEAVPRDAVWRHYIRGEQWERIRRKHHYSTPHVRRMAYEGLDRLAGIVSDYREAADFCVSQGAAAL